MQATSITKAKTLIFAIFALGLLALLSPAEAAFRQDEMPQDAWGNVTFQ